MRRMLKDTARAEGEEGGPLSKIHAFARSETRSLDVLFRSTTLIVITLTRERAFLDMARRSATMQFGWHDCDTSG